ncbi:MAG: hypothetical protein ALECFALPRED_008201 [Alectoria fallacina]|uniref:non-specific serine/threonine protein kinase n=1 Tax=Alectoria fallacina TaxID=1903189 RepID=A0A8H3J2Q5_9LECA|nr:MAG: hypothetical protein ALECFALPRED_008201 [Alectoria fallacina]
MTDYRDYCFDIQGGDIPLIIGCNGKTAYHFNDSESNLRLCCGFRSSHSRQSTPETPNPSVVEDSTWYAIRREPQAIKRGLRFGAAGKVDFRLANFPGTNRVSKLQFRIVLSEFNTWILIDESAAGSRVNEEKLVSRRALQNALKRGVTIQGNSQVALRPREPNAIEIGSLNFNIYIHCDPAEYQLDPDYFGMPSLELLELQSSSSLSTMGRSDPGLQSRMENAQFFLADDQLVASDNPWVRKMVHKDTGAVFIAKVYAETRISTGRDLYQRLRGMLKTSKPGNIIPFLSQTTIGDEYMIITDYWPQTVSLQQLLEEDDLECLPSGAALGFMFAQLTRALLFLAGHNVIHRDIKPAAILLADKRHYAIGQLMTARLSGFSESFVGSVAKEIVGNERYRAPEMNGRLYDAKVDVYSLSKLVKECLSLREAYLRKDPVSEIVALGLMEDAAERPSASHLCQSFDLFGGGHYEKAFHIFYVRRRFVLKCTDDLGEPEQTYVLPPSTITPTTFVREDKRASYNYRVSTARRTEMADESVSGKGPPFSRAMATNDLESARRRELSYDNAEEIDSKAANTVASPEAGGRDQSNRYDGFVASQRSASKMVLEPSRLEPYKSVPALGPSQTRCSSIDDWLDGQRALDINLIHRGDLYQTSDMGEEDEEEVPKKRRSVEKKLSHKSQNLRNKKSQSSSSIRSQTRKTTANSSEEQSSRL